MRGRKASTPKANTAAHLLSNKLVRLVEEGAALRVAEDDPLEANVLELLEPVSRLQLSTPVPVSRRRQSTHEISPV